MRLLNSSRERKIIAHNLHVADNFWNRIKRLFARDEVLFDHAVLVTPCTCVNTLWLKMPIDVIFLDQEQRIIALHENIAPWESAKNSNAASAIELTAGSLCRHECKIGDILVWED